MANENDNVKKKPIRKKIEKKKKENKENEEVVERDVLDEKKNEAKSSKNEILNVTKESDKKTKIKKKEHSSFKLWEVVVVMLVTLIFGLFIGSYATYSKYDFDKVNYSPYELKEVHSVYKSIMLDYYKDVDQKKLNDYAILGMLYSLGDNHAALIDKYDGQRLDEDLNGNFIGLGVEIVGNENGDIEVVSVFKDSAAFKNDIKVGDIIVEVDSKSYNTSTINEMTYKIKNSKVGDTVEFTIKRGNDTLKKKVTLEQVELESVSYTTHIDGDKKVGIITISSFSLNTYKQFENAYNKLKEQGVKSLVIDLRNNVGGYLSSASKVLSLFLNKGDVIYQRSSLNVVEKVLNDSDKKITIPVVLLVNENTASSAEIFVSSLVDNLGVTVVGTKTYGKGTIQKLYELSDGRYVKFTVQEWLSAKGKKVDGVGIIPNVLVPIDENSNVDNQLNKAIEVAQNR